VDRAARVGRSRDRARQAGEASSTSRRVRAEITLGGDWSKTDDHSALMGCRSRRLRLHARRLGSRRLRRRGAARADRRRRAVDVRVLQRRRVLLRPAPVRVVRRQVGAALRPALKVKASEKHAIAWDMRGRTKDTTIEIERLHTTSSSRRSATTATRRQAALPQRAPPPEQLGRHRRQGAPRVAAQDRLGPAP
jgi:hypothetical protein